MKKNMKGYLLENTIDIGVSLIVYKVFGFEIAVIVVLALIMADVGTIMKICMQLTANQ